MRSPTTTLMRAAAIALLALAVTLAGCNLPFGLPAAATPAATSAGEQPAGTQAAGTTPGPISSSLLTQVAATLYAPYAPTLTAQAAQPGVQPAQPASPQNTQAAQAPQPTADVSAPTQAAPTVVQPGGGQPTAAQPPTSAVPPSTVQPLPTTYTQPTPGAPQVTVVTTQGAPIYLPQPTAYTPANPPYGYTAQSGRAFRIAGVNLPSCGGALTANFLILNNSGYTFQSLSMQISDLSAGTDVFGPYVSDAPFMFDDRVCVPGGYSQLPSGYAAFVGAAANSPYLSGHALQANLLLCTGPGLTGRCYPRSVEFTVP